ncbi:hypothetical protein H5410_047585 [Solanum commersonii]|uniref:Uncharacterized protein n=1 Tax=Solanum commersonii TaxID=4109 RepID=A0A9J5XHR1_SOLCO|nr:hypothetical protein H5410_047585 [Solanum commersonii]
MKEHEDSKIQDVHNLNQTNICEKIERKKSSESRYSTISKYDFIPNHGPFQFLSDLYNEKFKEAEVHQKVKHGKRGNNQTSQWEREKLEKKVKYHHIINWIRLTWNKGNGREKQLHYNTPFPVEAFLFIWSANRRLLDNTTRKNNSQIFSKIQDKEDEKAWLSGNQKFNLDLSYGCTKIELASGVLICAMLFKLTGVP